MLYKVIIIAGATASGKSAYALELAKHSNGVIINADSMQVYKELPILTAQPSASELAQVEHKLYGIIPGDHHFSVGIWLSLAIKTIEKVVLEGRQPIVVGGTGFYLKALIDGLIEIPDIDISVRNQVRSWGEELSSQALYNKLLSVDPKLAQRLKLNDKQRVMRGLEVFFSTNQPLSTWQMQKPSIPLPNATFHTIHICPSRETIYNNCNRRFLAMLDMGLLEEVKQFESLHYQYYPKILGLEQMLQYLRGIASLEQSISLAQQLTRNFAKRQLTWLRHQFTFNEIISDTM